MTGPLLVRKEKPTPRNFPFWKQAISIIGAVLGFVGVWLQIHSY
jgi:hypothetical protein